MEAAAGPVPALGASGRGDRARCPLSLLRRLPAVGVPRDRDRRRHARLHDDGARAQHRRRLRGPARPRLRRVLRRRRVRGGLARVAALRGHLLPLRVGGDRSRCAGNSHLGLARAPRRRALHDGRRHPHRAPDPAPPGRLPRHCHARVRRDHPAVRAQRRRARNRVRSDARDVRHHPDRLGRGSARPSPPSGSRRSTARRRTAPSCTTGPPSRCSSSPSSARFACATRGWAARGSRSGRTRRLRLPWASR